MLGLPKKVTKMLGQCSLYKRFFLINFKAYSWKKRASVASNNDNVYKFINTAKKPAVLGFFVNFEF